MASVTQLLAPQCLACRKMLIPGAPSASGATTINAARGWHVCGTCRERARTVLGGAAAVAGRVLEQRQPELFALAREFYIGMRARNPNQQVR